MPETRIAAEADPREIISDIQSGESFTVEHVSGGEVWLDHDPRDVTTSPARTLTEGDQGTISHLRGEGVYAYAPENGAVLHVSRDGFLFGLFGTKASERPQDRAARTGYASEGGRINNSASDQTVGAGNSPVYSVIGTGDSDGQQMLVSSIEATNNYDPSVSCRFTIQDADSNDVYQVAGMIGTWPIQFDAQPKVPEGGAATIRVNNPTASAVDVRIAHTWREV